MKKKVLLVEDDPFLIDIYSQKFEKSEIELSLARSGAEAMEFLKNQKPDLMLLDVVLPHLAGWEILEKIKKDPQMKDLRVIILSNLSQQAEVEKGLSLGAEKYMIKSQFTPAEIVATVEKMLKD